MFEYPKMFKNKNRTNDSFTKKQRLKQKLIVSKITVNEFEN